MPKQRSNPIRNERRRDIAALGRRQYLRATRAGKALMQQREYKERDLIA